MELLWENGGLGSTELVKMCFEKYEWKKSTVYTMLKRMEEKKAIINQDAVVTPQLPKKEAAKDS